MQMVFMTFRSSLEDELLKWLETERVSFTFVEKAHGKGATGHAPGSRQWGGTSPMLFAGMSDNTILFAGISDDQLGGFRERIQNFQRTLQGEGKAPVPFHVFVMPCIQWF